MSIAITAQGSIAGDTRTKILDVVLPQSLNASLITLSCGGSDPTWEIFFDKDINDLAAPSISLTTATTGGNILRNTLVHVRVTTVDANGIEGVPSAGFFSKLTGSTTDTNKVTVSWSAISGAVLYRVYAGITNGSEMLVGETASTSYIITDVDMSKTLTNIPTMRDVYVIGKRGGVEPLPISGGGLLISYRLIVYVTAGASATPAFSLIGV